MGDPIRLTRFIPNHFMIKKRLQPIPPKRGLFFLLCFYCLSLTSSIAQEVQWFEGITHPIMDSTLGSPNDGVIGNRYFEEGDSVKQGEVIIELATEIEKPIRSLSMMKMVPFLLKKRTKVLQVLWQCT